MSDPFYSDEETSKKSSSGPLMPIVEVPSEAGSTSQQSTARSELSSARSERSDADTEVTAGSDGRSDQDSEHYEDDTPQSSRPPSGRQRKPKTKNGKVAVDLTPPDRLLKKAVKKSKRYMKEKKADKAIKELIRCTALARIVHGNGNWKLAKAHVDLAAGYLDLKGYAAQAQYHCDTAKSALMSGGAQISSSSREKSSMLSMTMQLHYTLGRALSQLKKLREAEAALGKAEKVAAERAKFSSVSDDDIDDWDIKIYIAIARVSAKQQKFAMATSYFEKGLEILEDVYGSDSTRLIPVYQGLGAVEQSKDKLADHEKAIEYYLQAHSIAAAKYKSGSVELADTAGALADAYAKVGNEDADTSAESYLNECLATYQSVYGPSHEKTIDIQDDLARLMVRTDRADEAISLLRSTFDSKREVFGEFSSEVADTWKLIGSVYLSQGETEKALRALKKCHSTECTLYGTNHRKSKDTQRTMDILLANPMLASKQRKSKAEELKERPRFSSVVSRSTPVGTTPVPS